MKKQKVDKLNIANAFYLTTQRVRSLTKKKLNDVQYRHAVDKLLRALKDEVEK